MATKAKAKTTTGKRGMRRAPPVRLRAPDPAKVTARADKALASLMSLYAAACSDREPDAESFEHAAWAMARAGILAIRDLVVRTGDPEARAQRAQLVRTVDQVRRGPALVRALEVTAHYAERARAIGVLRERVAREYLRDLRALDLDELGEREVPPAIVGAELATAVKRSGGRRPGPPTILARVLVLHRDGAIAQTQVRKLQTAIAKAERSHRVRAARLGDDGE